MFMKRKIKILECIRQGQIGGGESHLLSLVENLERDKFDPVVLSFTEGPMIERLHEMNVPTHVIHTLRPFDFRKWKMIKGLIRDIQPDIIHAHGTRANSNIIWAAKSLQIPVIYTIHGWSFHQDQKPFVRKIRIMGERYLTQRSDINIAVSESNRASGQHFIESLKAVVINNGIDQHKFDPQRVYRDIRTELNIPLDKILILFIARFTAHKQPLTLIQAFSEAIKVNPGLYLLMVGDGDQRPEAETLIKQLNLFDHVTIKGFRQDVPDVLAAADIFVLPSLWEGLPIGLLEAMSMGKAVIATNVDGTKEVVKNEENGLLIDTEGLISKLANAILDLSQNGIKRKEFGKKAMETVQNRFNAVKMTRQIEEIYTAVSGD
ncbi:MAG: glycosyltransferase [Terrimonas sp.]|nr:glycosyltransferase [Terrimonas sp.]